MDREKGREFSETEGTPRALSGGILSPRGWEMLELDVYEWARQESHGQADQASRLLGPGDPRSEKGDNRISPGIPEISAPTPGRVGRERGKEREML